MAFKMKGFSYPGKSPIKQDNISGWDSPYSKIPVEERPVTRDPNTTPEGDTEINVQGSGSQYQLDHVTKEQDAFADKAAEHFNPPTVAPVEDKPLESKKEGFDWGAFRDDVIGTTSEALIQTGVGMAGAAIAKSMQKKEKREAPVPTFGSGGIGSASKIV